MSDDNPTQSKRIRFDPTVTYGHVLTIVSFMIPLGLGWMSLDKRVVVLEENRATQRQVDLHQNDMQRSEMAQIRESLAEIKRSVERVNDQLTLRPQTAPPQPPYRPQSINPVNRVILVDHSASLLLKETLP